MITAINRNKKQMIICVGTAKAGTSSLYSLFAQHDLISVSQIKETGFFYRDNLFSRGEDYYLDTYFDNSKKILFEADPDYMYFKHSINRIYKFNPETQIIILLRNPVDRAFSHHSMMVKWGLENLSFPDAIKAESKRLATGSIADQEGYSYLARGMYANQIEHILSIFPKPQVHFLIYEDFFKNTVNNFIELQKQLKLPIIKTDIIEITDNMASVPKYKWLNAILYSPNLAWLRKLIGKLMGNNIVNNSKIFVFFDKLNNKPIDKTLKSRLTSELRNELIIYFNEDIQKVEKLVGLDLTIWKK